MYASLLKRSQSILKLIYKWRYKHLTETQFIYILAVFVGFLSGMGAVALKNITFFIHQMLERRAIKDYHNTFYFLFPVIGLLLVILVVKYIIKKKVGHGIPSTLYTISKQKGIMSKHQMWASLITAPLTVGFGGSVGLEGPTVATGAALGSNFSQLFYLSQTKRTLLVGAATAGAMAAIFKAPIAAIVFAVEIFSLELTLASVIPLLLASIMAVLTSFFFLGDEVLLHFKITEKFVINDVIFYIFLGISTALTSIYFSQVYFSIATLFKRWKNPYIRLIIGGLLIGIIVFSIPPLFGEGYETINNILKGNVSAIIDNNIFHIDPESTTLIILFLIGLVTFKVVAMSLTFGAGGVGGVFAPTLFTGSVSGYIIAVLINHSGFFTHQLSPTNFAMVGMAGLMAGVLQAPLTAIFLIAEITGGYELFIPLMIVASISFIISKHFLPHSIYTLELAKKGELITHDKDKNVIMMMDFNQLIETDLIAVKPDYSLGKLLRTAVAKSSRNLFPVIDNDGVFLGVVLLDDIRDVMFKKKLYKKRFVHQYMHAAPEVIYYDTDDGHSVMEKFNTTGAWNLPVLRKGKYYGFISRSKMLTAYRTKLIEVSV